MGRQTNKSPGLLGVKRRPTDHYQSVILSLVSAKADLNKPDVTGSTALALSIRCEMSDVARVLVRYGADADAVPEIKDEFATKDGSCQSIKLGISDRDKISS